MDGTQSILAFASELLLGGEAGINESFDIRATSKPGGKLLIAFKKKK